MRRYQLTRRTVYAVAGVIVTMAIIFALVRSGAL